jgi:hypothetical protein
VLVCDECYSAVTGKKDAFEALKGAAAALDAVGNRRKVADGRITKKVSPSRAADGKIYEQTSGTTPLGESRPLGGLVGIGVMHLQA